MMAYTERLFWGVAVLTAAAAAVLPVLLTPSPFSNVHLITTYQENDRRFIHVDFVKNPGCMVQEVVWVGKRLGVVYELTEEWTPSNKFEDDPGEHRLAGEQTLMGSINLEGQIYDTFEIRTRHDCNGTRVDRTFISIDVGDDIAW